jgi:hypothetical protein
VKHDNLESGKEYRLSVTMVTVEGATGTLTKVISAFKLPSISFTINRTSVVMFKDPIAFSTTGWPKSTDFFYQIYFNYKDP